jgi:hypothetical protein
LLREKKFATDKNDQSDLKKIDINQFYLWQKKIFGIKKMPQITRLN